MRLALAPHALHDPEAPPEEAATSGILSIEANGICLTEGVSVEDDVLKTGPLVSAYPLAEWLVWNWWRLRWEPTPPRANRGWAFAHRLSTIGGGNRWPDLELASDGVRVRLSSGPSMEPGSGTFRYVGAPRSEAVAADAFESAVDGFVQSVAGRLEEGSMRSSNLALLAADLTRDRSDGARSSFRRLEAMLGCDPGEGQAAAIRDRLSDARSLGEGAILELAAGAAPVGVRELRDNLTRAGFDFQPGDTVKMGAYDLVANWGATDAWRIGVGIARRLREQELCHGDPVTNRRLAEMMGVTERVLSDTGSTSDCLSFEWEDGDRSRMAMRSKWMTGRRFDLTRLLAERLLSSDDADPLRTVTRSYTYRQKAQRAFAAEFLAPIDAVDEFLAEDYSDDRQDDAAQHFQVSPYAIRSLLVNNHRVGRQGALDALDLR